MLKENFIVAINVFIKMKDRYGKKMPTDQLINENIWKANSVSLEN